MSKYKSETDQKHFAFLHYGTSVLGADLRRLLKRFASYPIGINTYVRQGFKTRIIEVDILEWGITLHCVFTNSRKCSSSQLFFEDESILMGFEEYLHEVYKYDEEDERWLLPEGYLYEKEDMEVLYLVFERRKE